MCSDCVRVVEGTSFGEFCVASCAIVVVVHVIPAGVIVVVSVECLVDVSAGASYAYVWWTC